MTRRLTMLCVLFVLTVISVAQDGVITADSIDKGGLKLARAYRYGINTDVDLEKAAHIYKMMANNGNVKAMVHLGDMYSKGEGVERNTRYAFNLFLRAAKGGNSKGMCKLARMYQKGDGIKQNFKKAFYYYDKAARKGNPQGCYGAGYLLYKGYGVKQNYRQAEMYLKAGARKHHAGCDFLLGMLYANDGAGTPDYDKAEKFYHRAMKDGNSWTKDMTKQNKLDSLKHRHASRHQHQSGCRWQKKLHGAAENDMKEVTVDELCGTWHGTLYSYDWSNSLVVDEETVTLQIDRQDDSYAMQWFRNDTLCTVFQPDVKRNYKWVSTKLPKDYRQYPWVIKSAQFGMTEDGKLCARFRRFSTSSREPLRPSFVVMEKEGHLLADNQSFFHIDKVLPMPIAGSTADVTITSSVECTAHMAIYNMHGIQIADGGSKAIVKGVQTVTVNVPSKKGRYVLQVTAKGVTESKNIIHL